jgi:branched-chain amino acid transport system permease protein
MGYLFTQLARIWENLFASIGAHLTVSVAGIHFFGFPVIFSLSAYIVVILAKMGVALPIAVMAALAGAFIVGVFFAALYRRLSNDSFAVFTLASILAFDALVRSWDSVTGGVLGISGIERPAFAKTLLAITVLGFCVAAASVLFEYLLLNSSLGRALQAHKESPRILDATGKSAKKIGSTAILIAVVLTSISGILTIWRIQFLDPSFGGIPAFLMILTMTILAVKPRISWIVSSTLVISLLPEILKFFSFPPAILGHLRILVYAVLLIILVRRLSTRYTGEKRLI